MKFDAIQNICLFISVMILDTTSDLIMAKIHFPLSCKKGNEFLLKKRICSYRNEEPYSSK